MPKSIILPLGGSISLELTEPIFGSLVSFFISGTYQLLKLNISWSHRVSDELTNIDQYICSKDDGSGRRFLEIECQDDKTFKFFKKKDTATV